MREIKKETPKSQNLVLINSKSLRRKFKGNKYYFI